MKTSHTLMLTALVAVLSTLTSCRTMRGFGRDVQHVGSKIETTAQKASPY